MKSQRRRQLKRKKRAVAAPMTDEEKHLVGKDVHELRGAVAWFPASPFMIVLLKELIEKMAEKFGLDGNDLLYGMGIEDLRGLSVLNEMSGMSVADYLGQAYRILELRE